MYGGCWERIDLARIMRTQNPPLISIIGAGKKDLKNAPTVCSIPQYSMKL